MTLIQVWGCASFLCSIGGEFFCVIDNKQLTIDAFDDFLSYTPRRRIFQLKSELAQISEVGPTLHDQDVSVVILRTQNLLGNIVILPRGYAF